MITYLLLHFTLAFLNLFAIPLLAAPALPPIYGAPAIVGPAREVCSTEAQLTQAIILTPEADWQQALQENAQPGDTFLLRGGLYAATDKIWLKAGTAQAPITLKPYNCEAVTLHTSLRPNSYNIIAGLQIEAQGISDQQWVVRFDGKNEGALTTIVLRNNLILGGTIDAIRISGNVQQVEISGNQIDGGRDGHDLFVTAEGVATLPTQIVISENQLTKAHFTTASEDMLQVRDVGKVEFTHNTCTNGYDMEQCVDIKRTTEPLTVAYNLFDGDQLHLAGTGEDHAGGCMVIHEEDTTVDQQIIEYNLFRHCKGSLIRFATGDDQSISSGLVRYNLFLQNQGAAGALVLESAVNTILLNNTFIYGSLKLGNSEQSRIPQNTVIKNTIFYQTTIEDHMPSAAQSALTTSSATPGATDLVPYQCMYNLFYQLDGTFAPGSCSSTVEAEPRFINISEADFRLQATSPAIGEGENGADIGAFAALLPFANLTNHAYLPLTLR